MSLKELTWENHKKAERKEFARLLITGKITPELYFRYLANQWDNYTVLEAVTKKHLPTSLHSMFRSDKMLDDMAELGKLHDIRWSPDMICKSTCDYVNYVYEKDKAGESKDLLAHLYVRHFGDMYGGAIIQKKVPGSGRMYDFVAKDHLIAEMRQLLNDDMADEANLCFDYAIRLFEELTP